jgi:hypothetical protein
MTTQSAYKEVKAFIDALAIKDPLKRLGSRGGAAEIKQHALFANIDFDKVLNREYTPELVPPVRKFDDDVSPTLMRKPPPPPSPTFPLSPVSFVLLLLIVDVVVVVSLHRSPTSTLTSQTCALEIRSPRTQVVSRAGTLTSSPKSTTPQQLKAANSPLLPLRTAALACLAFPACAAANLAAARRGMPASHPPPPPPPQKITAKTRHKNQSGATAFKADKIRINLTHAVRNGG